MEIQENGTVLTDTEQQIYSLILQGKKNSHIAKELGVKEKTVKFHITSILKKKSVYTRTQLVAQALTKNQFEKEASNLKAINELVSSVQALLKEKHELEEKLRSAYRSKDQIVDSVGRILIQSSKLDAFTVSSIKASIIRDLGI